jgi:hypothetical protein
MKRDGQSFWVEGYEIFDRERLHSVCGKKGGFVPLTVKKKAAGGQLLIIRAGQQGRPIRESIDDIVLADGWKGDRYSFDQVFGRYSSGLERVFAGFEIDEADDVSLFGDEVEETIEADEESD